MDESQRARVTEITSANQWQLSASEYLHISETVSTRSPCNLLVFGVGNDSELWLAANRGGRTLFLEDSAEWIAVVRGRGYAPAPDIRRCRYTSRPLQWLALARRKWLLRGMPAGLDAVRWDVILVDAPRGYRIWHPGRLQAIAWAAHLAGVRSASPPADHPVDVFVHDYNRRTERYASLALLGRGHLVSVIDRLAHYRIHPDRAGRASQPAS